MSEALEQCAVVEYCDLKGIPVSHIPNGGYRNKAFPCRETTRQVAQALSATSPKRLRAVPPARCEEASPI